MNHFGNPNIYVMYTGDIVLISISKCKQWYILEGQYGIYDTSMMSFPYTDIILDLGKLYKR
jgi:hypothetical protein